MTTLSRSAKREALKRARELRIEFQDKGEEFTQGEFLEALISISQDIVSGLALEGLKAIAQKVDDESSNPRKTDDSQERKLFDLEGEYRLGETVRIAKRYARIEHAERALEIKEENLRKVEAAYIRDREELELLRPYWLNGITQEEAKSAYEEDHPSDEEDAS